YDAFGQVTSEQSPANGDRYGFTGQQLDSSTGNYNYIGRDYDAPDGRFTSQDRAGFGAGDSNLYRYVGNDPTNATDPTGQFLQANDDAADPFTQTLRGLGFQPFLSRLSNGRWYVHVATTGWAKAADLQQHSTTAFGRDVGCGAFNPLENYVVSTTAGGLRIDKTGPLDAVTAEDAREMLYAADRWEKDSKSNWRFDGGEGRLAAYLLAVRQLWSGAGDDGLYQRMLDPNYARTQILVEGVPQNRDSAAQPLQAD